MKQFSVQDKLGLSSIVLLCIAAITYGLHYGGVPSVKPIAASLRLGLPLFFLWLAWPDIARFPRWILAAIIPTTIIVAIWPRLLLIVIPLGLLLLFLQPQQRKTKKK